MDILTKPLIIISAINIFEGGPLTVLKECLTSLDTIAYKGYRIEAYVHKKSLFRDHKFAQITFHELPKSRRSWLYRIYYEYIFFYKVSKKKKPLLWLSLHDISPLLYSKVKQCVYCHNPSIFYSPNISEAYYDKAHFLFSLFYKYLYQINLKRNSFIIVQQDWIREKFHSIFHQPKSKILVAYPKQQTKRPVFENVAINNDKTVFIYAAFPRIFKNYEIIIQAAQILLKKGITNFEIKFTLSGQENLYSKKIKSLGSKISQITFLGLLSHDILQEEFRVSDVLIFPSKLETWGLPISEFKTLHKTILLANLEYTFETIGTYDKVDFFDTNDPQDLATKMASIITKGEHSVWQHTDEQTPLAPFTNSWDDMLQYILTN